MDIKAKLNFNKNETSDNFYKRNSKINTKDLF